MSMKKEFNLSLLRKKLFRRKPIMVIVIAMLLVVATSGMVLAQTLLKPTDAQQNKLAVKKEDKKQPQEDKAKPETPVAQSPQQSTAPQAATPQPAQSKTQPKTPAVPQSSALPQFGVQAIKIFSPPFSYCDNSTGSVFTFPGAYIQLTGRGSGTLNWQVEERANGAVIVGASGSIAVPTNQTMQELSAPGGLYNIRPQNPDTALRLHITSPNDMVTQWYAPTPGPGCFGT